MSASARTVLFLAWPQYDSLECGFWQRLRDTLARRGLRLVLTSTSSPPSTLGVDHVPAPPSIDAIAPEHDVAVPLAALAIDADALLAREAQWGAPSLLPAVDMYRHRAMRAIADHWIRTLNVLDPAAVVLWNGQHVVELLLDAASRSGGVPVMYVERAPVPQAMFADERGLSAASSIACLKDWPSPHATWANVASSVAAGLATGQRTWWEQPASRAGGAAAVRHALGIPDTSRVLLFAGQVDEDTQQFLFSPRFARNVDAFEWWLAQLRRTDDVFVLGKQHPKSRTPAALYRRILAASGVAGDWRTDLSIDDALAVADRVAAVNSTVLYEALARGVPVLSLGDWLLSGRGAAYEVRDTQRGAHVVAKWLEARDLDERLVAWRQALAVLLSTCLYTYDPAEEAAGMLGAAALADRIARLADRSHHWYVSSPLRDAWLAKLRSPAPSWRFPDASRDPHPEFAWLQAHALRFQLMTAASAAGEGRRIFIWGAGDGGRIAAALVEHAGGAVAGFVTSTAVEQRAHGRPLIGPDAIAAERPRPFVLVASTAARQIAATLTDMSFTPGDDFLTVDCDYLAASYGNPAARGTSPSIG